MKTGYQGTFVISWSQTDIDGLSAAPADSLTVGATWSWHGEAVRVDGPNSLLRLGQANGDFEFRKRAARKVQRLIGAVVQKKPDYRTVEIYDTSADNSFVVTDGARSYTATLIEVTSGSPPLLMFVDDLPPRHVDLWIVHHTPKPQSQGPATSQAGGVICFTPGTMISTPDGSRLVETLREGDRVQTLDNGAEEILWVGSRRMTGARLFAMPRLRPVRIRAGALGIERPDQELLVSPEHRMLVRGPAAQALFNAPEVLVPAGELVNGSTISVDLTVREVTYVHLLLPSHQILWANGVESESFHPASADLGSLDHSDRDRLLTQFPGLDSDPTRYGGYARRNLTASESAILRYEAA